MKILVTGATGYVGHKLALSLAESGYEIHALVRNLHSSNVPKHDNIILFQGDITNEHSISAAIKGCSQVYHTAALVKLFDKDASQFHKVNVEGTQNLLNKSLEFGVQKFLLTSSCSVIGASNGCPLGEENTRTVPFENEYDITKLKAEQLVKEYANKGLFTVIVSPSKVYGYSCFENKDFSVNKMIQSFISGQLTFIPKPGNYLANYCFIDDVVKGHIQAMEKGTNGEVYILGGENISYRDFFKEIKALTQSKATLIETPRYIVKFLALVQWIQFYLLGKEPSVTQRGIKHIFCNKVFSSEKAIRKLGYSITPLKDGLSQTIYHLKNQSHV